VLSQHPLDSDIVAADADEVREAAQKLAQRRARRNLVLRLDLLGMSQRSQQVARRRRDERGDATHLRQVHVHPAVEHLEHRAELVERRQEPPHELFLTAIQHRLVGVEALRRHLIRKHFRQVRARPLRLRGRVRGSGFRVLGSFRFWVRGSGF
jgi:hypothetical protein